MKRNIIYILFGLLFFAQPAFATIGGAPSNCVGQLYYYSSTLGTGGTWASSNTAVATITSGTGITTGIAPGTTTISYTLGSTTETLVVTVTPSPTAITGAPASIAIGATATLANGAAGGTWSSGNTAVATVGSSTGVVTGVSTGTVAILYNMGGCGQYINVTVGNPSAISSTSPTSGFTAYPNPTTGTLQINWNATTGSSVVILRDMAGRSVYSKAIEHANGSALLDLADLSNGLYLLHVSCDAGSYYSRVEIRR